MTAVRPCLPVGGDDGGVKAESVAQAPPGGNIMEIQMPRPRGRALRPNGSMNCNATAVLMAKRDLREFLKWARPDWALAAHNGGRVPVDRVMAKLEDIGVIDMRDLLCRIRSDTLNMDLTNKGHSHFSFDTLMKMKEQAKFLRRIEHVGQPYYRQIGPFAPVPQLLSKTNRWVEGSTGKKGMRSCGEASKRMVRPNTAPDGCCRPQLGVPPAPRRALSAATARVGVQGSRPRTSPREAARARLRSDSSASSSSEDIVADTAWHIDLPSCVSGEPRPLLRFTAPRSRSSVSRTMRERDADAGASVGIARTRSEVSSIYCTGGDFATNSIGLEADSASCAETGANSTLETQAEAEQMHFIGAHMRSQQRTAVWKLAVGTLDDRADAMLHEQQALDEKDGLFYTMRREGESSVTRRIIADNIRTRMKEESGRAMKTSSDAYIHSTKTNIKNQIMSMQSSRLELLQVKRKAQRVFSQVHDEVDEALSGAFLHATA